MTDDDLRRRFRTLDRVLVPDIWREVENQTVTTTTVPASRFSPFAWPIAAAAVAALVVAAVVGAVQPILESRVAPGAPRAADAPFTASDALALGVLPGDVPGLGWGRPSESDAVRLERVQSEMENFDEDWREHLVDHGLEGRWEAVLAEAESRLRIVSRVSLWATAQDASEAFAYESSRLDLFYDLPAGPLTPISGLRDEGWCQMLQRERSQWEIAFCFFRVGNATIDLHARAVDEPYPLAELEELARVIARRAQALAQSPDDLGERATVSGAVVVRTGTPVLREEQVVACEITGPNAGIRTGTPVLIRDKASDAVLARGALSIVGEAPDGPGCEFSFEIPLVPHAALYSIRIEGRDTGLTYSRDSLEAAGWHVETMELD